MKMVTLVLGHPVYGSIIDVVILTAILFLDYSNALYIWTSQPLYFSGRYIIFALAGKY